MSQPMTRSELRHELRVLLRLLARVMRDHKCHRRMRHAIAATTRRIR
jgi:hypothetical protein